MKYLGRLTRYAPGLLVALLAGCAIFNTVMNNAYQYGATFYDSAEFATVIWHSGLTLYMGPAFDSSIYTTHASTINYILGLPSYFYTGDRMDYYGLVYALLYGATIFAVYTLLLPLCSGRWRMGLAALGAWMLFCSQSMYNGSWEMRSDFAAPLCMLMAFRAWQLRQYHTSVAWFILNAMVREDLGIMIVVPVALLTGVQYYACRFTDPALARERRQWGIRICLISLAWAFVTIYIQKHYFPIYDLVQAQYYDRAHPFAHLSYRLIENRFFFLLHHVPGIWLPVLMVAAAAFLFRDWQLLVGAIAFMPYVLGMFFSKSEMSAQLGSYKAFLLVLPIIWPAIVACGKPQVLRRHYAIIQCLVLLSAVCYIRPDFVGGAMQRWLPQPLTYHAQLYRDFGDKQLPQEHPFTASTRVSHGILALYPYQFSGYQKCWIALMQPDDADKIDTLIWFQNDRDQGLIDKELKTGHFAITAIAGTRIRVAHRISAPVALPAK